MTTLWLGDNNIGDEGAKAIGGALADNRVLKSINLEYNSFCLGRRGEGSDLGCGERAGRV